METYNSSPEQSESASVALIHRSIEILEANDLTDAIWHNLGFHVATVKLQSRGVTIPIGPHAQAYIALVLAAAEHVKAQELLEDAAGELLDA